jgi:hypothetical protein
MNYLPTSPLLGQLRIKETYDFYSQPCIFICINTLDQLFLALLISVDKWLYLPLSNERYTSIKEGDIDLYSAFKNSETNTIYMVYGSHVDKLTVDELQDEWLPDEGEYLMIN